MNVIFSESSESSLVLIDLIDGKFFKLFFEDLNVVLISLNQELQLFDLYVGRKLSELSQEGQHFR